jgi:hypothetical protein
MTLFKELYMADSQDLPTPQSLLGNFQEPRKDWPDYEDPERDDCLRETLDHQNLLFHFLKEVVLNETFQRNSGTKKLSEYVHFSLEAYLVLTYVNNYATWKAEVEKERGSGDEVSEVTTETARLYTEKSRGRGKYKGWSEEGILLYKQMYNLIERQRKDTGNRELKEFDMKLMERFRNSQRKHGGQSSQAEQVKAGNWLSTISLDDIENLELV